MANGSRYRTASGAPHLINNQLALVDRDIKDINTTNTQLQSELTRTTGQSYLKAALPTDGTLFMAVVTDEAGGPTVAFWDGTDWRRSYDLAVVS